MVFLNRENKINLIIVSIIIILDQISKYIITLNYDYFLNKNIIIFSINYARNYGAAFNIFEGNRIFLSSISILSSLILIFLIFFNYNNSLNNNINYKKNIFMIKIFKYWRFSNWT